MRRKETGALPIAAAAPRVSALGPSRAERRRDHLMRVAYVVVSSRPLRTPLSITALTALTMIICVVSAVAETHDMFMVVYCIGIKNSPECHEHGARIEPLPVTRGTMRPWAGHLRGTSWPYVAW